MTIHEMFNNLVENYYFYFVLLIHVLNFFAILCLLVILIASFFAILYAFVFLPITVLRFVDLSFPEKLNEKKEKTHECVRNT